MAVAIAMRRLLRVLELEEEQAKTALDSEVGSLRLLEQRLDAAIERNRNGRQLVHASAQSGDVMDRWAGIQDTETATRVAAFLEPRVREAEGIVATRQKEFLAKRVERRQAETLIEEAEAREAVKAGRRNQQALDDWYLNRLRCTGSARQPEKMSGAVRERPEELSNDQT